jgi:hypothetical protein
MEVLPCQHIVFMANKITLDLSNPALADLKDKQPGDTCDLKSLTVEVTANDGKQLSGDITEAELGDEYNSSEQPANEPDADETDNTATQAMKMK